MRFTGKQVTTMVVAVCAVAVLVPVGAYAVGTAVNIVDATSGTKARVNSTGQLWTVMIDPTTGARNKVDPAGKLNVGDGSGALTVDGTVRTIPSGTVPGIPGTPFANGGLSGSVPVPAGKHLVVESVSVQASVTPESAQIQVLVRYTTGGNAAYFFLPVTYTYTQTYAVYVGTQPVKLYCDPGTSIYVDAISPNGTTGPSFLNVSGYLV